jgi:hypothetical protein
MVLELKQEHMALSKNLEEISNSYGFLSDLDRRAVDFITISVDVDMAGLIFSDYDFSSEKFGLLLSRADSSMRESFKSIDLSSLSEDVLKLYIEANNLMKNIWNER